MENKLIVLKENYTLQKIGNSMGFFIKSFEIKANDLKKYNGFKIILQPGFCQELFLIFLILPQSLSVHEQQLHHGDLRPLHL